MSLLLSSLALHCIVQGKPLCLKAGEKQLESKLSSRITHCFSSLSPYMVLNILQLSLNE